MQYPLPLALLFLLIFSNCADDDAAPADPYGYSTQTSLIFTPTDGSTEVYEITYGDPDGIGPLNDQLINSQALPANQSFTVAVSLSDTGENGQQLVDKNRVILADATKYEVEYTPSTGLNLALTRTDQDANGDPVGLQLTADTGAPSMGHVPIEVWKDVNSKTTGNLGGELANRWVVPLTIK